MEQKLVRVPFEVELAKKITDKSVEGKVVTRNGRNARIICFDAHCDDNIVALIKDEKGIEYPKCYVSDGYTFLNGESDSDLMLEVPEYMTFKDGDILYCKGLLDWVFIYKKGCHKTSYYAAVSLGENRLYYNGHTSADDNIYELRLATEAEKQKLIYALKESKEPKAKEYLKRFFGIDYTLIIKQEYEFKPFDRVLVRDGNDGCWHADIFSHKNKDRGRYYCTGYEWRQCIPYNDQTKHLLGTTDNWEG